jgi:hypothetical protein
LKPCHEKNPENNKNERAIPDQTKNFGKQPDSAVLHMPGPQPKKRER